MKLSEDAFPSHEASLSLTHNEHRDNYMPLREWLDCIDGHHDFASKEAWQRAIDTDSYWVLHWYPITPIGHYRVAAPTLEEVLALGQEVEKQRAQERGAGEEGQAQ